jgi:hypothetical protein
MGARSSARSHSLGQIDDRDTPIGGAAGREQKISFGR